jgi:hypothetical protein
MKQNVLGRRNSNGFELLVQIFENLGDSVKFCYRLNFMSLRVGTMLFQLVNLWLFSGPKIQTRFLLE